MEDRGEGEPGRMGGEEVEEEKAAEVGDLKGLEEGEIGGKYATMLNILHSKKGTREKTKKTEVGGRNAFLVRREVQPPPPLLSAL